MINHTFAICAYKDSPYLEECIQSLLRQTYKSNIIMCTSTPSEFIRIIAKKYKIDLYIREGSSDISLDWNFAYNSAITDYVTLVHQDDIYHDEYLRCILEAIQENDDILILTTDYQIVKGNREVIRDLNGKIRRILRAPLNFKHLSNKVFIKKFVLAFGNSICCPSVTYHKQSLGSSIFTSDLKFNLDWDNFLKITKLKGRIVNIDKILFFYRPHQETTTKLSMNSKLREIEDYLMFTRFWPKWIAKIIMVFYKKAYKLFD